MDLDDASVAEDPPALGKRKWSESNPAEEYPTRLPPDRPQLDLDHGELFTANKKLRLPPKPPVQSDETVNLVTDPPRASLNDLPPEIIQNIFSFVDPISLGCLLRVNRLSQALLDPSKPLPKDSQDVKHLSLHPQDHVWSLSRRRWIPSMPRPMDGFDEHETMKLVFGVKCQFCGRRPPDSAVHGSSFSAWNKGPGNDSVRIIWPFKIRSCFACLRSRMKKDTHVFLSPASPLMSGLPYASFTSLLDFVPAYLIRRGPVPPGVDLAKYYYSPQIDSLENQARESRAFGQAAAEEWFKGLETRAQEHSADTARFEQWEDSGGFDSALQKFGKRTEAATGASSFLTEKHENYTASTRNSVPLSGYHMQLDSQNLARLASPVSSLGSLPSMPLYQYGPAPGQEILRGGQVPSSDSASQGSQRGLRSQRPAKSTREIARLRAERRHEIEKRCRGLDPPIYSDMLERLDAFVAAIQIPMPLNENAWETLKSRLLAQRREIELNEEAKDAIVVAPIPGQFTAQEQTDEYWLSHAQKSIREKVCEYADEYIRHRWGYGTFVNYANAPQFAADVLQHVRSRYFEVSSLESESRARQNFQDPSSIPPEPEDRILRLEHMKWVFDQTIKPRTQLIRTELFLCNECNINGNKHYGFDSVIQHYASKHTNDLSRGTQIVYWKAEWPAHPPFNPHPERLGTGMSTSARTPTLSDMPVSITNPESIKTPYMRSAGNRSPGTMSLLSSQTGLVPSKTLPTSWPQPLTGPPGVGIYHLQRDEVADEAVKVWEELIKIPDMPENLLAYAVIQHVGETFIGKYKNEVSLSMFLDCVRNKSELQPLNNLFGLNCKYCAVSSRTEPFDQTSPSAQFSVGELLEHFQEIHLKQNHTDTRLDWKVDIIQLPSVSVIRGLIDRHDIDERSKNFLNHALQTVLCDGEAAQPQLRDPDATLYSRIPSSIFQPDGPPSPMTEPRIPGLVPPQTRPRTKQEYDQYMEYRRQVDILQEKHRRVSRTRVHQDMDQSDKEHSHESQIEQLPSTETANFNTQNIPIGRHQSAGPLQVVRGVHSEYVPHSPRESVQMARTSTMRSQAVSGRGSDHAGSIHSSNLAEKFLDNFDSIADVAMDQSSTKGGSTVGHSRPQSLSGSQVDLSQTSKPGGQDQALPRMRRPANLYDPSAPAPRSQVQPSSPHDRPEYPAEYEEHSFARDVPTSPQDRVSAPAGRYVEYDPRAAPMELSDRPYREWSPRRYSRSRHYVDDFGRRVEIAPSGYGNVRYREVISDRPRYVDETGRPIDPGYGSSSSVEYIRHSQPPSRQEVIYDQTKGRYYIERPAVREYIELDDRYRERPPPTAVYREIPAERRSEQDERMYDRYSSDPYEDRYMERR